jgi:hypothetical protein
MDEMNYDAMGKEALRAECRDREISYSKMNNEQMRAALRADDAALAETDFVHEEQDFEMSQAELAGQAGRVTLSDYDKRQIADEAAAQHRELPAEQRKFTTPRATRAGLKIESNREERNGVKRPSIGGVCRAVWDFCDSLGTPTAKQIREAAPSKGWNPNNAMIEFYQWRKFNGISGRAK